MPISDRVFNDLGQFNGRLSSFVESVKTTAPDSRLSKKALDELRAARQKQDAELKKAREELREVLSLQQEAQLVLLGFLD